MNTDRYFTLAGTTRAEVREKASRFMATAFPIVDEEDFKRRLAEIARGHPSARHICFGWVLGDDGERYRAFDAGEPQGSAGKPILRQLQGAGLTWCAIVVVRYFGGALLGKAGLARAFAAAAKEALAGNTVIQRKALTGLWLECGYEVVEEVKRQVLLHEGEIRHAEFTGRCTLHVALPKGSVEPLSALWLRMGAVLHPLAE